MHVPPHPLHCAITQVIVLFIWLPLESVLVVHSLSVAVLGLTISIAFIYLSYVQAQAHSPPCTSPPLQHVAACCSMLQHVAAWDCALWNSVWYRPDPAPLGALGALCSLCGVCAVYLCALCTCYVLHGCLVYLLYPVCLLCLVWPVWLCVPCVLFVPSEPYCLVCLVWPVYLVCLCAPCAPCVHCMAV